jgi:hypothetical protein
MEVYAEIRVRRKSVQVAFPCQWAYDDDCSTPLAFEYTVCKVDSVMIVHYRYAKNINIKNTVLVSGQDLHFAIFFFDEFCLYGFVDISL